jgi:hypothetical protein
MRILLLWDRSVTHNPKVIHFLLRVVALYRKIENSLFRTWFVFVTLTWCCLEPEVALSDDTGVTCKFCFLWKAWLIIWHYNVSNFMQNWRKKFLLRHKGHVSRTRQQILAKISSIEFSENRFSGVSSCFKMTLTTVPWTKSIVARSTIPVPWLYKLWHYASRIYLSLCHAYLYFLQSATYSVIFMEMVSINWWQLITSASSIFERMLSFFGGVETTSRAPIFGAKMVALIDHRRMIYKLLNT